MASQTATGTFSITVKAAPVAPPLVITSKSPLPDGTVGVAYSFDFAASGGTPPYKWAGTGLPAGLTLSPSGFLTGTPTEVATGANISVTVTDSGV